jgi:hypothetical protein
VPEAALQAPLPAAGGAMAAVPERAVLWITFTTNDEARVYRYINSKGQAKIFPQPAESPLLTDWLQSDWAIVDVKFDVSKGHTTTVLVVERISKP